MEASCFFLYKTNAEVSPSLSESAEDDAPVKLILPALDGLLHPSMRDAILLLARRVRLGGEPGSLERLLETREFVVREARAELLELECGLSCHPDWGS